MKGAALLALTLLTVAPAFATPRSVTFGRFGKVALFGEGSAFKRVAVFVSGGVAGTSVSTVAPYIGSRLPARTSRLRKYAHSGRS